MPMPPLNDPKSLVVKVTADGREDVRAKDYVPIIKLHRVMHPDEVQRLMADPAFRAEVAERLKVPYGHRKYRERKGYDALHGGTTEG